MILSAAGHRFYRLPGMGAPKRLVPSNPHMHLVLAIIRAHLEKTRPDEVICGMHLGFDVLVGVAALQASVPVTVALPHEDWGKKWPTEASIAYRYILDGASRVHAVSSRRSANRAERHEDWILTRSTCLIMLWDGKEPVLRQIMMKAYSRRVDVKNLWDKFVAQAAG